MITKSQTALKSCLAKIESLRANAGEIWTDAEKSEFDSLMKQATEYKANIEREEKAETMKAWAAAPDGQSIVRQSFTGEAINHEGEINGVTDENGEMRPVSKSGEEKLNSLKSGAYKDAVVDYLRSVGTGRAMKASSMKVLQEGADTSGGFWVPPDYRAELIKKIATMTSVRQNAYAFTTGSDLVSFPKVTYTTDDKYSSGVAFSWTAEAPSSDISEATNPIAGRVTIPIYTATAAIILTRALLEDNQFDLLGYVNQCIAEAYALGEEDVFTNGNGSGKPEGFLQHANASVAHASGGMMILSNAPGAIAWGMSSTAGGATTGIIGVEAALPPQYEANAKWMANKTTWAAHRALTDSNTRPLWNPNDAWPNAANGMAATLLGYPVLKNQFMPDIAATTTPVAFGDFQGYYIADRVGLSIEVLREVRALRDEVVIYARKRLGGKLVHDWKLKLEKSNNS